jgi:glycogen debranching enzyme
MSELHRRDISLVDATMRPREWEYQRYIYLVELYRSLGWDGRRMWDGTPFKVADVGLNAILMRDEKDLLVLAESFGTASDRERLSERAERRQRGMERLWHQEDRAYYSRDLVSDAPIRVASYAGFLPLWGGVGDEARADLLAKELRRWLSLCEFGAPTMAPDNAEFDQKRYWRGPVWAIVNWMIRDGAQQHGFNDIAERLGKDTRELIERSGFSEYYDPLTGEGLGGQVFSWTAAAALAWALN